LCQKLFSLGGLATTLGVAVVAALTTPFVIGIQNKTQHNEATKSVEDEAMALGSGFWLSVLRGGMEHTNQTHLPAEADSCWEFGKKEVCAACIRQLSMYLVVGVDW